MDEAIKVAVRSYGTLDVVIANAGYGIFGDVKDLAIADFQEVFDTNFLGTIRLVKAALPELILSKGCLVIIGSVAAEIAMPGAAAYSASKHALKAFCDSLRAEVRHQGIHVTHIQPGYVQTQFLAIRRGEKPQIGRPSYLVTTPEKVARATLTAIKRRQSSRSVSFHAFSSLLMFRLAPRLSRRIIEAIQALRLKYLEGSSRE